MALPLLLGALGGLGGKTGVLGLASGMLGLKAGIGGGRRRRRRRLTHGDIMQLAQIKGVLGKTAAANALPFYMGGR